MDDFERRYLRPTLLDRTLRPDAYAGLALVAAQCAALGEPLHVLDIGCGPGVILADLFAHGTVRSAVGIDSSASMIEAARARLRPYVDRSLCGLITDDFLRWPPGSRRFDVVFALGVLDYEERAAPFVQKASRLARRCLIFNVPDRGLRTILRRVRHPTLAIHDHDRASVRALCDAADLQDASISAVPGAFFVTAPRRAE